MQTGCITLKKPLPRSYSSDRMIIAYSCEYPLLPGPECNQPGDATPDTLCCGVGPVTEEYYDPQSSGGSGGSPPSESGGVGIGETDWVEEESEDEDDSSSGSSGTGWHPPCITDPNIMCE